MGPRSASSCRQVVRGVPVHVARGAGVKDAVVGPGEEPCVVVRREDAALVGRVHGKRES